MLFLTLLTFLMHLQHLNNLKIPKIKPEMLCPAKKFKGIRNRTLLNNKDFELKKCNKDFNK